MTETSFSGEDDSAIDYIFINGFYLLSFNLICLKHCHIGLLFKLTLKSGHKVAVLITDSA